MPETVQNWLVTTCY